MWNLPPGRLLEFREDGVAVEDLSLAEALHGAVMQFGA